MLSLVDEKVAKLASPTSVSKLFTAACNVQRFLLVILMDIPDLLRSEKIVLKYLFWTIRRRLGVSLFLDWTGFLEHFPIAWQFKSHWWECSDSGTFESNRWVCTRIETQVIMQPVWSLYSAWLSSFFCIFEPQNAMFGSDNQLPFQWSHFFSYFLNTDVSALHVSPWRDVSFPYSLKGSTYIVVVALSLMIYWLSIVAFCSWPESPTRLSSLFNNYYEIWIRF